MQVQKAWGEMLHAGCSAMSWSTENHRHLWGRNFDFNRIAKGSGITYLPKGTRYSTCTAKAQRGMPSQVHQRAAYAAVGTGLLALSSGPVLYEGINEKGLMGGQLYYRPVCPVCAGSAAGNAAAAAAFCGVSSAGTVRQCGRDC